MIVLVERAKDLKGSSAKHETLERAITLFMDLPALSPPYEPAGGAQEGEEGSQVREESERGRTSGAEQKEGECGAGENVHMGIEQKGGEGTVSNPNSAG